MFKMRWLLLFLSFLSAFANHVQGVQYDPLIKMFEKQEQRLSKLEGDFRQLLTKIDQQLSKINALQADVRAHHLNQDTANKLLHVSVNSGVRTVITKFEKEMNLLRSNFSDVNNWLSRVEHCPQGFFDTGTGCYRFIKNAVSHSMAKTICKRTGASPVAFETKAEWSVLNNWMKDVDDYWTAGNDMLSEGAWRWDYSGPRIGFFVWDQGEPNSGRAENCLVVFKNGAWNDAPCTNKYPFICEATRH